MEQRLLMKQRKRERLYWLWRSVPILPETFIQKKSGRFMCISMERTFSIRITQKCGISSGSSPHSTGLQTALWQIIKGNCIRSPLICIPLTRCGAWSRQKRPWRKLKSRKQRLVLQNPKIWKNRPFHW